MSNFKEGLLTLNESSYLKGLACLSMLIDHIGGYLLPHLLILRLIGRIAMPLFAYQLTIGYQKTKNEKNYFNRLTLLALFSQIPYFFLGNEYRLNILFTFLFSLLLIKAINNISPLAWLYLGIIPFTDYGFYGAALVLLFYYTKSKNKQFLGLSVLTIIKSIIFDLWPQLLAILSYYFIARPKSIKIIPSLFFYLFYPVHLTLILIIQKLFIK
jgi:hypothetical protein